MSQRVYMRKIYQECLKCTLQSKQVGKFMVRIPYTVINGHFGWIWASQFTIFHQRNWC